MRAVSLRPILSAISKISDVVAALVVSIRSKVTAIQASSARICVRCSEIGRTLYHGGWPNLRRCCWTEKSKPPSVALRSDSISALPDRQRLDGTRQLDRGHPAKPPDPEIENGAGRSHLLLRLPPVACLLTPTITLWRRRRGGRGILRLRGGGRSPDRRRPSPRTSVPR